MLRIAFSLNSYEIARRIGRAIRAVGVMACGLTVLHACSGSDISAPLEPANASPLTQVIGTAVVGTTLDAPIRLSVTDAENRVVVGAVVKWSTNDGGILSAGQSVTDSRGVAAVRWTMGTVAGLQTLTATVAGLPPVFFGANAVADRAASVSFGNDLARLTVLGDTLRVATTALDRFGNVVSTPAALTIEGTPAVLAASGNAFVARSRGTAYIRATVDTASSRLTVLVDPSPPTITRVSPDTLYPGAAVTIDGIGFPLTADLVNVTIGGVPAIVTKTTAARVEAVIASTYNCGPTTFQRVNVAVSGETGAADALLRTSTRVSLAKGESANILDVDQVRCTELVNPAGNIRAKFMVAVINTSVTAAATSGFELRGAGAGAMAGRIATPVLSAPSTAAASASLKTPTLRGGLRNTAAARETGHDHHLEAQRALRARYGSPEPTWRALAKVRGAAPLSARAPLALGDTVNMKALYNSCTTGRDIRARVVYTGTKSVVLEDVSAPRAGQMDDQYRLIGDEFDRVQYPLMQSKVGDPLAMDNAMGGDGRVTMLFTRYVNDSLAGITGYVSACNFYPKGTFAASNEDEVFYARVASANESGDDWRRSMRSTVMHETKHLASFAIRFRNNTPFEELWLEESTARLSEELYARTFANGGAWKGNATYQSTVRCEVLQCDDRPLMMWKHFSVLHQYLRGIDTLTPIGAAANGDFTFYASGWSLVRWAADQYATDESTWIKDLVRGGQLTGLANLAQRTGRPAGEMLADWSLAQAVDDLAGFTPARRQLTFPSWNVADVFAGLAGTFPGSFVANPLYARAMTFGSFALPVTRLRAFSSSYFTFEGTQSGSQMIELRGENGATLPPTSLRLAIVRVE